MTQIVPRSRSPELILPNGKQVYYAGAHEPYIGRFVLIGLFVLASFIGGAAYWSVSSNLDGAVVAPASFVVEGNRNPVEHIDGGTIEAVLIDDGDFVEEGQVLMQLDGDAIAVDVNVLGSQLGELSVRRARLMSQIEGKDSFTEADANAYLESELQNIHWFAPFLTQKQLFDTEARARLTEREINTQQIANLQDQIRGLEEQRQSTQRQIEITAEEIAGLETLFEKGLVTAPRLNARRVEAERLIGSDAALRTQIAVAENQIRELELARLSRGRLRDEALTTELASVEAQVALVQPQFLGAVERQQRTQILAPTSGRVVNLEASRAGAVIRPGERILDIVPEDNALIVEARIATVDIDKLQLGQETRIRLSAFQQADVPEATGSIFDISADALEDERTGEPYFLARVKLDEAQPSDVASLTLLPGMPADLFVRTGERTAFSYLAQPISDRLAKTFIE